MSKDFDAWNAKKKVLDTNTEIPFYFKEGDVWWASTGLNIGFEQDGKGAFFRRPVLIVRKFNQHLAYTVPLTFSNKNNPYYVECIVSDGEHRQAIVSQCNSTSSKRLSDKIGTITKMELEKIRNAIKNALDGVSIISPGAELLTTEPEGHCIVSIAKSK